MHLTAKQIELLRVISAGNGADDPADLDEILERVRYETTKASLQFSIRALIGHGLIEKRGTEKRRGRQRQVIAATVLGSQMVGGPAPKPMPTPVGEAALVPLYLDDAGNADGTALFDVFEPVGEILEPV